jgi:hypothetical protein
VKRTSSFVEFANACTEEAYTNLEERHGWRRNVLNPPLATLELECEQLYRVASLIAFGHTYKKSGTPIGLATRKDIERFSVFAHDGKISQLIVELPSEAVDIGNSPRRQGTPMEIPSKMQAEYPDISAAICRFSGYQTFTLSNYRADNEIDERTMSALLGQLIANHFALKSFRGWVDGKPQIEADDEIGESWVTLASLPDRDAPGLCQCCGKVLDRQVDKGGGRRVLTCGKNNSACSAHFNNEQRRLTNEKAPEAQFTNTLEQKAREIRWRDNNDGRPLQYPGIHLPIGSDG